MILTKKFEKYSSKFSFLFDEYLLYWLSFQFYFIYSFFSVRISKKLLYFGSNICDMVVLCLYNSENWMNKAPNNVYHHTEFVPVFSSTK